MGGIKQVECCWFPFGQLKDQQLPRLLWGKLESFRHSLVFELAAVVYGRSGTLLKQSMLLSYFKFEWILIPLRILPHQNISESYPIKTLRHHNPTPSESDLSESYPIRLRPRYLQQKWTATPS